MPAALRSPFDPRTGFFEQAALAALRLSGFQSLTVPTAHGRTHALVGRGAGELPPVLLLHGFSSSGVHYGGLMRHLRPHVRRLVAPDLLAHGFSESPARPCPGVLEKGLMEALDVLVDEPMLVYGNSMGGLAALRFALRRPERVLGLVLCSPMGAPMDEPQVARFLRRFEVGDHARALAFVDRVFTIDGPMRHLVAWGVRRKFGHPLMTQLIRSLSPGDLLQARDVRSLQPPVLFVWGGSERVLPPEHKEFFLAHLPRSAQVEEPPLFGHGPYLTDPGAVARQILSFARSLDPGARSRSERRRVA